jgi:hypothetical protein
MDNLTDHLANERHVQPESDEEKRIIWDIADNIEYFRYCYVPVTEPGDALTIASRKFLRILTD